ncbi:MAG TPA: outer membrane beta-barrel protein [Methyloceanibacter sp.]|jgi:outer membrane immunogenic protein
MTICKTRGPSLNMLGAIGILHLLATPALAADFPQYQPARMTYAPAFDWTGSHIGLSGGYAFDGHDASYTYNGVAPEEVAILPSGASLSSNGGIIGGNIGYDAQFNGVVVGVEADLSWTNFGDDTTHVFPGEPGIGTPPITFATSYQMDWFSTVRGRIGLPFGGLLIYGTGGLAFANVSMNTTVTVGDPPMGALTGAQEETKVGWTLGGGAEYAITDCVTIKAEALYFDLGSIALNASTPQFTDVTLDVKQQVAGTIARAGVSYRF